MDAVQNLPENSRIMVLAPIVQDRKGEYQSVFEDLRRQGYARVRVDGDIRDLSETITLDKYKKHSIEVVVDRLVIGGGSDSGRVADSVETALKEANGIVIIATQEGKDLLFSEHLACVACGVSLGEIAPRTFSFNNPTGHAPSAPASGTGRKSIPTWC